ncbi:MAG: A24 family peptidase [Nanoarchaeota archaeon]|nr:A24 family peptidase [Nanoarchaeota archaeon]
MEQYIFLFVLAFIWILIASICDLKKREVPNWINFSLPVFALGYRAVYSVFVSSYDFILIGVIGYLAFIVFGYLLYYGRVFAGGDAKLMMGLGAVLPFGMSFWTNFSVFFTFMLLFFIVGAAYGLLYSFVLTIFNFSKFKSEFKKQYIKNKKFIIGSFLGVVFLVAALMTGFAVLLYLGVVVVLLPLLYIYGKSLEEVSMVKNVSPEDLTEGDWLYEDVKVKGKVIKANWDGLEKEDIEMLKKAKKNVLVKYGIPFVPVFFFAFVIYVYLFYTDFSIIDFFLRLKMGV